MRRIHFTLPGGVQSGISVWPAGKYADNCGLPAWVQPGEFACLFAVCSENEVRRKMAILAKMDAVRGGEFIAIHHTNSSADAPRDLFHVYVSVRNFPGRASYYGGMIYAYERTHPRGRRKTRRSATNPKS